MTPIEPIVHAAEEQGRLRRRSIESLIARNALALSIAANGAFRDRARSCAALRESLALSPAVAQRFDPDPEGSRSARAAIQTGAHDCSSRPATSVSGFRPRPVDRLSRRRGRRHGHRRSDARRTCGRRHRDGTSHRAADHQRRRRELRVIEPPVPAPEAQPLRERASDRRRRSCASRRAAPSSGRPLSTRS